MLSVRTCDGDLLVSGYGLIFNSVDGIGDYFTPETEFYDQFWPKPLPVLWHHGLDPEVGKSPLGFVESWAKDDFGLRVNMRLDNLGSLRKTIVDSVAAGELGMSSGSHPTLVKRSGRKILQWILREISLTETPAECATKGKIDWSKSATLYEGHLREIELQIEEQSALKMLETPSTRAAGDLLLTIAELEQSAFFAEKARRLDRESKVAYEGSELARLHRLIAERRG